jgi:hypothetical protein
VGPCQAHVRPRHRLQEGLGQPGAGPASITVVVGILVTSTASKLKKWVALHPNIIPPPPLLLIRFIAQVVLIFILVVHSYYSVCIMHCYVPNNF